MIKPEPKIPKWADRLLVWYCAPDLLEEVQGDLYETFHQNVETLGVKRARRRFIWNVLSFFNWSTIKGGSRSFKTTKLYFPMFKNYLKVSLRLFAKNKIYLLINTLGLGLSIACCLAGYLFYAYNIEFDDFHDSSQVSLIYKIHSHTTSKSQKSRISIQAPLPLAPAASNEIPSIKHYTRFIRGEGLIQMGENRFQQSIHFADSTFFNMFHFPLRYGNYHSFRDKNSIFLTESLAEKLFSTTNPIGQSLTIRFQNEKIIQVMVGGVLEKIPLNNTFVYEALIRMEHYHEIHDLPVNDWSDWRDPSTFVQLTSADQSKYVSQQLSRYIPIRNKARTDITVNAYQLEPFLSKFNSDDIYNSYVNIRWNATGPILFGVLAAMILVIACFNLTNTSIVMSTRRLKEIGIRKAIGAARQQIITQFLYETTLIMILSLLVGLGLAYWIILPEFNAMLSLEFGMEDLNGINLFIALLLLIFSASFFAGIYPALFNSKLDPVALVKGAIRIKGTNWLTRILISGQFALSVIFLAAGAIFIQNIGFQNKVGFGYKKDQLITIQVPGNNGFQRLANVVDDHPEVLSVGVTDSHVGYSTYKSPVDIAGKAYEVNVLGVGKNYLSTIGLSVIRGRNFSAVSGKDTAFSSVIVNEAFLKLVDLKDPFDHSLSLHNHRVPIIGVVNNHIDDIDQAANPEPFVFYLTSTDKYRTMVVQTKTSNLESTYNFLQSSWNQLFPNLPFDAQFQDEIALGEERRGNTILIKIFLFLAVLGTLLSVAGIFSLASLNIANRSKEIGVRKVLGATVSHILLLLNKEFAFLLLFSAILGGVGGYFLIEILISVVFLYHVPISFLTILISAVIVISAGLLTTSGSTFRAAVANPVNVLRSE